MASKLGPKIVTDNLVLALDCADAKSYPGEPTTNFFYRETPRIDSSYSTYVHASNSTWAANHPDALIVYNTDGTAISSYVNQGANSGNWQVIAHAHWVYDNDLRKPVVKMHRVSGYEGEWRALSRGLGHTLSELGLTAGDKFTISWLQKAYVEGVYARAGIYMRNTGGSNGFHAGQATSSDVGQLSSELGKWAHKSKTFTVPSGMNETGYDVGLYMYGHYSPTNYNTIYISDVQVEKGDYATPIVKGVSSSNSGYWGTRSATDGWVDLSGNSNDGTLVNGVVTGTSHYRSGDVILPNSARYLDFDGTDQYITISSLLNQETINASTTKTIILWLNVDSYGFAMPFSTGQNGNNRIYYWTEGSLNTWRIGNYTSRTDHSTLPSAGTWFCTAIVINGLSVTGYLNGTQDYTGSYTAFTTQDFAVLGRHGNLTGVTDPYYYNGKIGQVLVYNEALTATEILNNYNSTKSRFS